MNYLQLVNKVLDESGKEQNPLTLDNWNSAEAGRRLYPRVKRLVAEAWKIIQIKRNEWEFNTGEQVMTIRPRMRFVLGTDSLGLPHLAQWTGRSSGIRITALLIIENGGAWPDGTVNGQVEFSSDSNSIPIEGEVFELDGSNGEVTFEYTGPGSYKLFYGPGQVREPRWDTFKARRSGQSYALMSFTPWSNFQVGGLCYAQNSSVPVSFSQDYMGDLVFNGQSLKPFDITFVYDIAPQQLVDPQDVPAGLPLEYHEWISWAALMNLARFDKDPDLFAYAEQQETIYRQRAERNLMPLVEWSCNRYNYR